MGIDRRAFADDRTRMVEVQLRGRGITDARVLAAFARVPRHLFVREEDRARAYDDHPLSIGHGQTISQPYMVATMLAALRLEGRERVLEVGTGSGYQTALLLELAGEVWSVERIPELARRAEAVLETLEPTRLRLRVGDGSVGLAEGAPYDRIVVSAGSPRVPPSLVAQLAPGGILAIPVGDEAAQDLVVVRRPTGGGRVTEERLCSCIFVKLIGAEGWRVS
ncbi:MAG: protein-L-isoaspartate(D-aspartate) O-methyltransferase [Planctomycetes bacterium]|nr:protein-L-isoaspartate(D-aspartate) O-methyltransferase [Planctomycetota bacterium]